MGGGREAEGTHLRCKMCPLRSAPFSRQTWPWVPQCLRFGSQGPHLSLSPPSSPPCQVNLVSEHIWCEDFLVRSFYLKNLQTNETRTVTQFHFLSWYDRGVPSSSRSLLDFRRYNARPAGGAVCAERAAEGERGRASVLPRRPWRRGPRLCRRRRGAGKGSERREDSINGAC